MYLSLRTENVDEEDCETGRTAFVIYMLRQDLIRCKQLLMRGANVNYRNLQNGLTPLHIAINASMSSRVIRFLIKNGANPHFEDLNGLDCCDKVAKMSRYQEFRVFRHQDCRKDQSLRIEFCQNTQSNNSHKYCEVHSL